MNFSVQSDVLSRYLSIVTRVISSKSTLPSLNNVLFQIQGSSITLLGTDLETQVQATLPIKSKAIEEQKIGINAKILTQYVASLSAKDMLNIKLDDNKLFVYTEQSNTSFNTIPLADYPLFATKGMKKLVEIPAKDFTSIIQKTTFTCEKDYSKPTLTGVNIELDTDQIIFVSLDGYRLSFVRHKLTKPLLDKGSFIVSANTLNQLGRLINDLPADNETVTLYKSQDSNFMLFEYQDIKVFSRLLEGDFPDYKQLIPTSFQIRLVANKAELQASLKRVDVFAQSAESHKVTVEIQNNTISLSSTLDEIGQTKDIITAKTEGGHFLTAFQGQFLSDALNHIEGNDVVFETVDANSPGIFRSGKKESFFHLIMPLDL